MLVCHIVAKEVPGFMQASMLGLAALTIFMGLLWIPQAIEVFLTPAAKVLQEGLNYASGILGM